MPAVFALASGMASNSRMVRRTFASTPALSNPAGGAAGSSPSRAGMICSSRISIRLACCDPSKRVAIAAFTAPLYISEIADERRDRLIEAGELVGESGEVGMVAVPAAKRERHAPHPRLDEAPGDEEENEAEGNEKKGGTKAAATGEYLKSAAWNVLSGEEQAKVIEAKKKSKANEDDDKSTFSSKSIKSLSKMLKSLKKSNCKLKNQ